MTAPHSPAWGQAADFAQHPPLVAEIEAGRGLIQVTAQRRLRQRACGSTSWRRRRRVGEWLVGQPLDAEPPGPRGGAKSAEGRARTAAMGRAAHEHHLAREEAKPVVAAWGTSQAARALPQRPIGVGDARAGPARQRWDQSEEGAEQRGLAPAIRPEQGQRPRRRAVRESMPRPRVRPGLPLARALRAAASRGARCRGWRSSHEEQGRADQGGQDAGGDLDGERVRARVWTDGGNRRPAPPRQQHAVGRPARPTGARGEERAGRPADDAGGGHARSVTSVAPATTTGRRRRVVA